MCIHVIAIYDQHGIQRTAVRSVPACIVYLKITYIVKYSSASNYFSKINIPFTRTCWIECRLYCVFPRFHG